MFILVVQCLFPVITVIPVCSPANVKHIFWVVFIRPRRFTFCGSWVCSFYLLFVSLASQQSSQSPMSLTSDASSPRSYVSPRISTPQTNAGPLKPILSTQPVISQPKVRRINSVLNENWAAEYLDEGGKPTNANDLKLFLILGMLNNVAFHLYINIKLIFSQR